jgi:hypothetical protein
LKIVTDPAIQEEGITYRVRIGMLAVVSPLAYDFDCKPSSPCQSYKSLLGA